MEQAQHQLLWAQPEIVLYDTLRDTHPGYPDILQDPTDAGRIVITETQKTVARLHEIPHSILQALETQHSVRTLAPASGAKRTYSTDESVAFSVTHLTVSRYRTSSLDKENPALVTHLQS